MGPATQPLIQLLGLPHWYLRAGASPQEFTEIVTKASEEMDRGNTPFVFVEKGAVGKADTASCPHHRQGLPSGEVLRMIVEATEGAPIVATTGYTGRELFGVDDRPANFYMQGSMGHASSLALGLALQSPRQRVTVLDGDGAALMHLGAFSVIGAQAPDNLVHVVLDNGNHESTGGQPTTSATTSLEDVAAASGYRSWARCRTYQEVKEGLVSAYSSPGPHLLLIPTQGREGAMPPRATSAHSPGQMRDRFSGSLASPLTAPPS